MNFDLRQKLLDLENALRGPLQAWGWIVGVTVVVTCFGIVIAEPHVWTWLFRMAQIILYGVSTAVVTRFLGSMGMFKDAIADVLGEDRWLDRRSDLDDLWRRITRRIFLIGFREDREDAKGLLEALNKTMNKVLSKEEQKVNYYQRNMQRWISLKLDPETRRVTITDHLESTIIPFEPRSKCVHQMITCPSTGETLDSYTIELTYLRIRGEEKDLREFSSVRSENQIKYTILLEDQVTHDIARTMVYSQSVDDDPVYVVTAGRGVVWGMRTSITVDGPGLRISFEELGLEGDFRPAGRDKPGTALERQTEAALLPDQGFMIVMASTLGEKSATAVAGLRDL